MAGTRTVSVDDGVRLAVTLRGHGSPVVLCQPGGPGRASAYLENLAGLDAVSTLALVDTRGTGGSSRPDDPAAYRIPRLVDDLDAVRAALGDEPVVLLGHSAGCYVACAYAAAHPDRLAGLVLVGPVPVGGDPARRRAASNRILDGRSDIPDAVEAARALEDAPASERSTLERLARPLFYERWDERIRAHAESAPSQMDPRVEAALREAARAYDAGALRTALSGVHVPTLVAVGDLDATTPPAVAEEVAGLFVHADLAVLAGAGHFPWVDKPEQFRDTVARFLFRLNQRDAI